MPKSYQQIVHEITAHIEGNGGAFDQWYVGVAKEPKARLFQDHQVSKEAYIIRWAESRDEADRVEAYFVNVKGTQGGPGGGDSESTAVYAYHTSSRTKEDR